MLTVNKIVNKFIRVIDQLEEVSTYNVDVGVHKMRIIQDLKVDIDLCKIEADRATKIKKKFEELLEL